ncbi:MAG TPA: arginine--tRNA ligase [Candidatus Nanoperiomorbaceae bacterium]|nr:arginine--tRNA ligase [Candidatus Nanoperiomorbaceae bacterium]
MNYYADIVARTVKALFAIDVEIKLSRPDPKFGDVATNVAMQLAGRLHESPREIAETIARELRANDAFLDAVVAGPGFINITLGAKSLLDMTRQETPSFRAEQTIVIETNNPNPFKAMHIGHAFNAILGDTIANLLAVSGGQVYRVSYHGDVGLHVGKSMYALLRYADGDFTKIESIPKIDRNTFMSKMYAEGSKAYKEDETAKAEINDLAEQSFEPTSGLYIQIYDLCKAWSFEQIDHLVARLGNQPTVYRFLESDADHRGVEVVKRNVPKVFQESSGALIFEGSKYGAFDNVFVASNGRGLYAARDLGLMLLKNEQFHPDKSYIVTAEEQRDYFKGVIAAAGLVWPDRKDVTVNISTGTVKLTTGKMSSRDGDVIEIAWLFDQFTAAIAERGGEPTDEIIAGALRYQFLKVKIGGDVVFDVDEAVSLTGNTGSYLQYAHARARRILEKSGASFVMPITLRDEDYALVRKLGEYAEIVELATRQLEPHHICNYLFELAQEFNRYYEKNQVIGSEYEQHRLGLVGLYADILQAGLAILGIHAPSRM